MNFDTEWRRRIQSSADVKDARNNLQVQRTKIMELRDELMIAEAYESELVKRLDMAKENLKPRMTEESVKEAEDSDLAAEATDEAPARIVADLVVDVTPGRKSFRTPKPARKSSGPKPRKEVAAVRKSSRFLSKEKARARRSSIGFATVGVKASVKSNKKQGPPVVDVTPGRKSSRTPKPARKGCNTRLERGDEVVDIPQVKEAPKPNSQTKRVKDTHLTPLQMGKEKRRGSVGSVGSETSGKDSPVVKKGAAATPASAKSNKKQVTKPEKVEPEEEELETKTPVGRGRKRKTEETPASKTKSAKKDAEDDTKEFSDYDSGNNETQPLRKRPKKDDGDGPESSSTLTSKQQTAVAAALAAGVPGGQQRSVSCVADTNTQKEVVVECFAPYDDHRWVNIGKERDGMAPDAVQYARALRPPYHLLSFLRIKGHSTKGMSCTDKNTMVFVVLEGEITVILHTTQFNAKKGDSFYIPPKNYYNLINQKAREAELSLIQFQYDGPLPTVQPSNG